MAMLSTHRISLDSARGNGAFTLLELVVSLGILLVALMGYLVLLTHMMRLDSSSRETAMAMNAAQAQLEEIKLAAEQDFGTVYDVYNDMNFAVSGLGLRSSDPDGMAGKISMNDTNPDLIVTSVRIDWEGERTRARTLTLETALGSIGN